MQEAWLRPQAFWLSRVTQPVIIECRHDRHKKPAVLDDPIVECQTIKIGLLACEEKIQVIKSLLTQLDQSRLSFLHRRWNNDLSSMLLYIAAHYRTCSKPLDHVFGIMQVYGFGLGSSKDSSRTYTLEDLEDEFGAALNGMMPMTAQAHIHTTPPAPGTAWRPTRSSMLSDVYYMAYFRETMCSIRYENARP